MSTPHPMPLLVWTTLALLAFPGCRIEPANEDTPSNAPTEVPSTPTPTDEPTPEPTDEPTAEPTEESTEEPPRDQRDPEITYDSDLPTVGVGDSVVISTTVTDNIAVMRVTLYYRTMGDSDFESTVMSEDRVPDVYVSTIPGEIAQLPGVEYYIEARDLAGNEATAPKNAPSALYEYEVSLNPPTPTPDLETPTQEPTPQPTAEPTNEPTAAPTHAATPSQAETMTESPVATPTSTAGAGTPDPTPSAGEGTAPSTSPTPTLDESPSPWDSPTQPSTTPGPTPTEGPTVEPTPTAVPTPTATVGGEPTFGTYPEMVQVGQGFEFRIRGGTPPFEFNYVSNKSGGRLDAETGAYRAGGKTGTDLISVTDRFNYTAYATVEVRACNGETVTLTRDNGVSRFYIAGGPGDLVAMPVPVHDASFTPESVGLHFTGIQPGPSAPTFQVRVHEDAGGLPGAEIAQSDFMPAQTVSNTEAQIFDLNDKSRAFIQGETLWLVVEYGAEVEEGGLLFDDGRFNSSSMALLNRGAGWTQVNTRGSRFETTAQADAITPMFRAQGCHVPLVQPDFGGERITLITNDPDLEGRPLGFTYYPQAEGAQLAERFEVSTGTFELTHIRGTFLDGAAWSQSEGRFKVDIYSDFDGEPHLILASSEVEQVSVAYPEYHTFTLTSPAQFMPGAHFWAVFTTIDDQLINSFGMMADNGNRENNTQTYSRRSALTRESASSPWEPLGTLVQESILVEAIGTSVEGSYLGTVYQSNLSLEASSCESLALGDHSQYWALDPLRNWIWHYGAYGYRPAFSSMDLNTGPSVEYASLRHQANTDDGAVFFTHSGDLSLGTSLSGMHTLEIEEGNSLYPACTAQWSFEAFAL